MQLSSYVENILDKKLVILAGWITMALVVTAHRIDHHAFNNFLIFRYTYPHALNGQDLYTVYPDQYADSNHYGPLFSLLIAPFALLPLVPAMYLWQLAITVLLFTAINQLPLSNARKSLVALICTQELYVTLREFQTNTAIAALIILTWVMIENKKEFWAALFILTGFYIKLYGIVGLAFFFFSGNKPLFIKSLLFWAVVMFLLPMLVFSPGFILNSYAGWFNVLLVKNGQNTVISNVFQDVSVMGMLRKVSGDPGISTALVLLSGLLLFALPYFRTDRFKELPFRLSLLASVLIFTTIFSTGSELSIYVIAFAGIGIWAVAGKKPWGRRQWLFLLVVLYFGSLFDTDLSTYHLRADIIKRYALKALPCLVTWLIIVYEMMLSHSARQSIHKRLLFYSNHD